MTVYSTCDMMCPYRIIPFQGKENISYESYHIIVLYLFCILIHVLILNDRSHNFTQPRTSEQFHRGQIHFSDLGRGERKHVQRLLGHH